MSSTVNQQTAESYRLLLNVVEQLKLPFLQIRQQAELNSITGNNDYAGIQVSADYSLKLLDNYLLGLQLNHENVILDLESISISAVMYDTSQLLQQLALQYGVDLELNISGKFGPVLANRNALESALMSLGTTLIEAVSAERDKSIRLQLAAHKCRYGIVAGFYSNNNKITADLLKQGRKLIGVARQPITNLSYSSSAGIFVADSIFKSMKLNLQASRHHSLYGLGTVLTPSQQLSLI